MKPRLEENVIAHMLLFYSSADINGEFHLSIYFVSDFI